MVTKRLVFLVMVNINLGSTSRWLHARSAGARTSPSRIRTLPITVPNAPNVVLRGHAQRLEDGIGCINPRMPLERCTSKPSRQPLTLGILGPLCRSGVTYRRVFHHQIRISDIRCAAIEWQIKGCRCRSLRSQSGLVGPVVGVGPSDAGILIIGEAPGREEDEAGEPFIGSAGNNLTRLMTEAGLKRGEVYITNIVKCRPIKDLATGMGNKKPGTKARDACRKYLEAQIAAISPRAIIAIGGVAAEFLVGKGRVEDLRGRQLDYHGIPVVVTYHTSYLCLNRSPGRTVAVVADIRSAMTIARHGSTGKPRME